MFFKEMIIVSSLYDIPFEKVKPASDLYEYLAFEKIRRRQLFFDGEITGTDEKGYYGFDSLSAGDLVQTILQFNRDDCLAEQQFKLEHPKEKFTRRPIWLYVNSPGGRVYDGFAVASAIRISKTPVYTVNLGMWASMAFMIGIAGKKRFALPYSIFLSHDGSSVVFGTTGQVHDTADFSKRFEEQVSKNHILSCTKITEEEYRKHERKEWFMLPDEAKKYGCIDHIVSSLDELFSKDADV